jgi:hypothetical protein
MPYLGRKRVELWDPWEWWTLPQAVNYLVKLDGIEEARRQIHFALIDGALSLKWGAFGPPPNLSMLSRQEPEMPSPPVGGRLWETAEIDWEAGTVLDNFDPANEKHERRVLLVWRRHLEAAFDPKSMIPKLPPPINPVGSRSSALVENSSDEPTTVSAGDSKAGRRQVGSDTGAPGRPPKGINLCVSEFQRRTTEDKCEIILAAEARYLESWFSEMHKDRDPVKARSIENKIRDGHRDWKANRA